MVRLSGKGPTRTNCAHAAGKLYKSYRAWRKLNPNHQLNPAQYRALDYLLRGLHNHNDFFYKANLNPLKRLLDGKTPTKRRNIRRKNLRRERTPPHSHPQPEPSKERSDQNTKMFWI